MKTNTAKNIDTIERPLSLRIFVALMALFGAAAVGVGLFGIVVGLSFGAGFGGPVIVQAGLAAFVLGILELVVVIGLWKLKLWAWGLAVVGHSVAGIWVLFWYPNTQILGVQSLTAIALLIPVACLLMPHVRRVFWRELT